MKIQRYFIVDSLHVQDIQEEMQLLSHLGVKEELKKSQKGTFREHRKIKPFINSGRKNRKVHGCAIKL